MKPTIVTPEWKKKKDEMAENLLRKGEAFLIHKNRNANSKKLSELSTLREVIAR